MKRILIAFSAVLFLGTGSARAAKAVGQGGDAAGGKETGKIEVVRISIPSMTEEGKDKIDKALTAVEGVVKVKFDFEAKKVTVKGSKVKQEALIEALKKAGFEDAALAGGGEPGKKGGKGAGTGNREE